MDSFLLYDFFTPEGGVNEDVFAYSNRYGDERGARPLQQQVRGGARLGAHLRRIRRQAGRESALARKCLGEGLALPNEGAAFVAFRDYRGGLEYIRSCREIWEKGLYAELNAFRCQVFMDFRVVFDDQGRRWSRLAAEVGGRGVRGVDAYLREMELRPIRDPFGAVLESPFPADAEKRYERFLGALGRFAPGAVDNAKVMEGLHKRLAALPAASENLTRISLALGHPAAALPG